MGTADPLMSDLRHFIQFASGSNDDDSQYESKNLQKLVKKQAGRRGEKNKTWILKICHWQNYKCRMRIEGRNSATPELRSWGLRRPLRISGHGTQVVWELVQFVAIFSGNKDHPSLIEIQSYSLTPRSLSDVRGPGIHLFIPELNAYILFSCSCKDLFYASSWFFSGSFILIHPPLLGAPWISCKKPTHSDTFLPEPTSLYLSN